ncbi:glycosyl hydrolase family 71-domain-containing protein [Infundibulicybe gibba]|nr:glycosyl hydrolase family 71-domain-containing protein [Infundibulicybe gibba]
MRFGLLTVAFALLSITLPSAARKHHRNTLDDVLFKNARNAPRAQPSRSNFSAADDPAELVKRDGTKYVFMHHIVGNTYSFTQQDWEADIRQIQAGGADAIALNIGSSSWQRDQVASAYAAAANIGANIKLFYSFDFTEMPCDIGDVVARVILFANHPNQLRINNRPMISSYAGDCFGNSGWASIKSQTNGYLMPFIWGLEGQFPSWDSLDSWYCWGCAWPQGNQDKTTDDDNYYISQLGSRYATTISVWMFTHFSYKNFYQRGDNWLINTRWEQLVAMRNQLTFIELVTWNDFGESDYFGPIHGAQPDGTTWATGFPHIAWYEMSQYYITAFKTGSYPQITEDVIYYWARPHPAQATASSDGLGKPSGFDWTEDSLWAAVFATSASTVTLRCGSSSQTFNVNPGVSKLKIPLAAGQITVTMVKNGQTVINKTPTDFTFVTNPTLYNYNAYVGSAKSGNVSPPATTTTTSTSTTSTSSTTTSSTASSTPTGTSFSYLGCVAEGTTGSRRALTGASFSQSNMTPLVCQSLCSGFQFAGVEYGVECYCGNSLTNNGATGSVIPESNCQSSCGGDSSKKCGGSWTISVYTKGSTPPPPPPPTGNQWNSAGCYVDASTRMLRSFTTSQPDMTTDKCINTCSSRGYTMAVAEFGQECYCGSQLFKEGGAGVPAASGDCNVACAGNSAQMCGGGWRGNLFTSPGTTLTKRHTKHMASRKRWLSSH